MARKPGLKHKQKIDLWDFSFGGSEIFSKLSKMTSDPDTKMGTEGSISPDRFGGRKKEVKSPFWRFSGFSENPLSKWARTGGSRAEIGTNAIFTEGTLRKCKNWHFFFARVTAKFKMTKSHSCEMVQIVDSGKSGPRTSRKPISRESVQKHWDFPYVSSGR